MGLDVPLRSLHNHNPWAAPDPDDGDIRSIHFGGNPGGNGFSFTRTYTFNGSPRSPRQQQVANPQNFHDTAQADIMRNFESMFTGILGPAARLRGGTFGGQININGRTTTFGSGTYDTSFPAPMGMPGPE
jgi:hypothetical protein